MLYGYATINVDKSELKCGNLIFLNLSGLFSLAATAQKYIFYYLFKQKSL